MAAVGATNLWYESQPMLLLLLLGLVLVGSAYAGWRESCELFWATCAFLAGSDMAPMTSVLACEFHMLPKTCGWRGSWLKMIFRGVSINQGTAWWRRAALESNILLYS